MRQEQQFRGFYPLTISYGFGAALYMILSSVADVSGGFLDPIAVLMHLGAGVFVVPLLFVVQSYVIHWISRLLGGDGESRGVRTALAWGTVPYIAVIALGIPGLAFGVLQAESDMTGYSDAPFEVKESSGLASTIYDLISAAAGIWSIVIVVCGVAAFEGISKIRGFLASTSLILVVFLVFFVLGAVWGFTGV